MTDYFVFSGVILQEHNLKENDKLIKFYTKERGQIDILVQGARKLKSKLNPIISSRFSVLRLTLVQGQSFYRLIDGQVEKNFKRINQDYQKILLAEGVLKKLGALVSFQRGDFKILLLITKYLKFLEKEARPYSLLLSLAFLIKALAFVGYCPSIKNEKLSLSKKLDTQIFFDLDQGIFIEKQNFRFPRDKADSFFKLNYRVFYILQTALYQELEQLKEYNFAPQDILKAWKAINKFLKWQVSF
ncbi:DNA repair protein RecO [Patescibacteria group bacterium]|nr:DNA repair protein RecO [Patescibacteria group bacterium]